MIKSNIPAHTAITQINKSFQVKKKGRFDLMALGFQWFCAFNNNTDLPLTQNNLRSPNKAGAGAGATRPS